MSIIINRLELQQKDKDFIKDHLIVTSNTDVPFTINAFKVEGDKVVLPFSFYSELREFGNFDKWAKFPNDEIHKVKFNPPFEFKAKLRDYQEEVWNETLPILLKSRTVLIGAHCGWGKTAYTSFIASKIQLKTLILYHIAPLGRSWPSTFYNFTNAIVCHIGKDEFNPDAHVYIATVGSALSDKFPLDKSKVGFLVIDEAHCFCSPKRIESLLNFTPKYLLLLTATPIRADGMGDLLPLFHGRKKEIINKETIYKPANLVERISTKPFTVYKCNTTFKPMVKMTPRGQLDWQEVKKSLITRESYVNYICDWATMNPHKKILIPCTQLSQMRAIAEELRKRGDDVQTMSEKDDSYSECRVLVSIDKKCQLGFDDATTCRNYGGRRLDMIILAWTVKDKGVIEQICGRIRGENGTIIDIVNDFSSFRNHFKCRMEWYTSRNGNILEVPGPMTIK